MTMRTGLVSLAALALMVCVIALISGGRDQGDDTLLLSAVAKLRLRDAVHRAGKASAPPFHAPCNCPAKLDRSCPAQ